MFKSKSQLISISIFLIGGLLGNIAYAFEFLDVIDKETLVTENKKQSLGLSTDKEINDQKALTNQNLE